MDAIDWPGIRAASVSLGIRGAARRAASNLSDKEQERFVFRVLKRAQREGWEEHRLAVIPTQPAQALPLSSNVLTGAESAAQEIAQDKLNTRTGLARYASDAAKALRESTGNLKLSRPAKDIADIMSKLWPEQQNSSSAGIHIGVLTGQVAIQYTQPDQGISE